MPWQQHWPATVDFAYVANAAPSPDEELVWRDPAGALTVSKVGEVGHRHFRLRHEDWLFIDVLADRRFVARAQTGTSMATYHHFLADQVIPRAMEQAGKFVLHAAAVCVGDSVILLIGESGRGKSTLSTSFDIAGHPLLGDDATVISSLGDTPRAKAVYPSLRLLPDSLAALLPVGTPSLEVANYTSKQRLALPCAERESLPIRSAFILSPPEVMSSIAVRRLTMAETCMAFLENSFALDPSDTARARERMEQASALANAVPAFEIDYPRDYARLPEVRQTILDQVAALTPV